MAWHPNGLKQRLLDVATLTGQPVTMTVRPDGTIDVQVNDGGHLVLSASTDYLRVGSELRPGQGTISGGRFADFVEVSAYLAKRRAELADRFNRCLDAAVRGTPL